MSSEQQEDCKHDWIHDQWGSICLHCDMKWADAMRGFGSNVQPLSGRVKRVPRK